MAGGVQERTTFGPLFSTGWLSLKTRAMVTGGSVQRRRSRCGGGHANGRLGADEERHGHAAVKNLRTTTGICVLIISASCRSAAQSVTRGLCGQPSPHSLSPHSLRRIPFVPLPPPRERPTLDVTEALISLMLWARGAKLPRHGKMRT